MGVTHMQISYSIVFSNPHRVINDLHKHCGSKQEKNSVKISNSQTSLDLLIAMKQFLFVATLICCCQILLAIPTKDADLDKDFQSIEDVLEKMSKDEEKKDLEAELLKMKLPANEKKDKAQKEALVIEEDFAKEIQKAEKSKKDKESGAALHEIMKKFDSGEIKLDKLKSSLEDYLKKESNDLFADANEVEKDGNSKCEDARDDCHKFTKFCKSHEKTMRSKCAKTCSFCADCKNNIGDAKCRQFGKFKYCKKLKYKEDMKKYCFKECGYCKPPSINVPDCSKSKFGCCWDKVTLKQDEEGSSCPLCEDKYRNACKTFEDDCFKGNRAGEFMRKECPKICGLCKSSTCFDDPAYKDKCADWAALGWCKKSQSTMKILCQATCRMC